MKEKILPFIIGLLVGAIIGVGGFYLYSKSNNNHKGDMFDGNPPAMMQQDGNSTDGETPPDLPDGDQDGNSTNRPEKPSGNKGNFKGGSGQNSNNTDSNNT